MIIGLCGGIGAGKDSVADYLVCEHGYTRVGFADKLKAVVADLYGVPERFLFGTQEDKATVLDGHGGTPRVLGPYGTPHTVRSLCEGVGEGLRQVVPDTWVGYALAHLTAERVVFSDVRYANEFEAIRAAGGQVWEVVKLGGDQERTGHVSDEQWRGLRKDQVVMAHAGDMPMLFEAAELALRAPRPIDPALYG